MLNLNPPPLKGETFAHPTSDSKKLRCQDTGDCFLMDREDWEKAKHCHWWWNSGRPVNARGITFEDYVGIKGKRRYGNVEEINFCRNAYEPE